MQSPCAKRFKLDIAKDQVTGETIHPKKTCYDEMNAFYNGPWPFEAYVINTPSPIERSEHFEHPYTPNTRTKCAMCGDDDHGTTTCPSACCLKCGEKTDTFQDECTKCKPWSSEVCTICGDQGHSKNHCPDHWRCYHSTIDVVPAPKYSMGENPHN